MRQSERRSPAVSGQVEPGRGLRGRDVARGLETLVVWLGLLSASGLVWAAVLAFLRHLLTA